MNKFIAALIGNGLIFLTSAIAQAGNAQWDLNPASGDWNTAANWTPATVPNGATDAATFGSSNTTSVLLSANTQVDGITFTAGAPAYGIRTNPSSSRPGFTLTFTGSGITNNSAATQTFAIDSSNASPTTGIIFLNASTASNAHFFTAAGTYISFQDSSTAGSANIDNGGFTHFSNRSSAGSATIISEFTGGITFSDHSSASSAFIGCTESTVCEFAGNSTAGSAKISGEGTIVFSGSSTGGTAQISVNASNGEQGVLDISSHNGGVTIGSLESFWDGQANPAQVHLGDNNLSVGSNNLSTTFSGVISGGGSLTKIGTGTLMLNEANTYTGNTTIKDNGGVLKVDGSITSNTFVNHGGTLAGTGTIQGNVTNNAGTVSPGDSPGTLTVTGKFTQRSGTLLIDIAGANAGQFSVLNVLGTATLGGLLDPVLLNGFVPTIGESFTFLDYGAVTGSLFIFDRNIDNAAEHWDVTYQAKDAILTVATGNVPVADFGSTFLLLTLSLLGLVTLQRQLLHKQA